MARKFIVLSLKSQLFLLNEQCSGESVDSWTTMKGTAKKFNSKEEASTAIDFLNSSSICRSKEDCIVLPIGDLNEKGAVVKDFKIRIYHSQTFWVDELISAKTVDKVLDEVFGKLVKSNRVIMAIEVSRCKKVKGKEFKEEMYDGARFEKSL